MPAPKTRTQMMAADKADDIRMAFKSLAEAFAVLKPAGLSPQVFYRVLRGEPCTVDELTAVVTAWYIYSTRLVPEDVAHEALTAALAVVKQRTGKNLHPADLLRELGRLVG